LKKLLLTINEQFKSFGAIIVFAFISFSIIFTSIFAYVEFKREESYQVDKLNRILDQLTLSFTDSLTNSLWSLDDEQINVILNGILTNEDIVKVEINDFKGSVFSKGNSIEDKYSIVRVYPLIKEIKNSESVYLADLLVTASTLNIKQRLLDEIKYFIVTEFVKILFFLSIIFIIIKIVITRHLKSMTEFFSKGSIGKSQIKLELVRNFEFWKRSDDDLDKLVHSINSMIDQLHSELQRREKYEKDLTLLNESLENKVEKRTKDLLEANRIEAVIEMSAGISHEINSPLSVIHAITKRIIRQISSIDEEQLLDFASKIQNSTSRIFSITNALHMLSQDSEGISGYEKLTKKEIQDSIISFRDIFKSSIGVIDYDMSENLPDKLPLNPQLFYQMIYSLIFLRSRSFVNQRSTWVRLEFEYLNNEIIISCLDNGEKLSEKDQAMVLDPFAFQNLGKRGSNLIFGTFSTLSNKFNAKRVFVAHNKDVFIQIRIPVGEIN